MTITAKHNRIAVGLRLEEWSVVYYEPIEAPEDLTKPHCAPVVGLYSRSKGDAREDDPMFGEVAWEPLLSHDYVKSGAKAERLQLQRKLLWDAWRYLVAKEPTQIAVIKAQIQGSRKGAVLLTQLDQARMARSSSIEQTRKRREKRRQMKLEQGLPTESVEKYDDDEDSGLGSDGEAGEDNQEGLMPPPPPPPRFRRPYEKHSGLRASQPPRSRTREASSAVEDEDDVVEVARSASHAPTSRSRESTPATASSSKRRRSESPGSHSLLGRPGGIDRSKSLFGRSLFLTPVSSKAQRHSDANHHVRHESPLLREGNGRFDNEDEATAEAVRLSQGGMPEQPRNIEDSDDGLDEDESFGR
jgi:hypothetical protein